MYRTAEGFDAMKGYDDLKTKFGVEEEDDNEQEDKNEDADDADGIESKDEAPKKAKKSRKSKVLNGEESEEVSPKKVKKSEIMVEEKNRKVAEAIKEMADIYFRNKDMRKGGSRYNLQINYNNLLNHFLQEYFLKQPRHYVKVRNTFPQRKKP